MKIFHKIGLILRPGTDNDTLQSMINEDFEADSQDKAPEVNELMDPAKQEQI